MEGDFYKRIRDEYLLHILINTRVLKVALIISSAYAILGWQFRILFFHKRPFHSRLHTHILPLTAAIQRYVRNICITKSEENVACV